MSHDQARRTVEESAKKRVEESLGAFHSLLQYDLNINVFPLKDKVEEWHFNIWPKGGKYENLCIHGVFEFPREYPKRPPNIEIVSPIIVSHIPLENSNVVDVNDKLIVKLPMLQSSGWDPSTPVTEILDEVSQIFNDIPTNQKNHKDEMITVRQQISQYTCMWCGHTQDNPIPDKGKRYGETKDEFMGANIREPQIFEQHSQDWRDATLPGIECSFARVYFEAEIEKINLSANNLTGIRVGWCVKNTYERATGECELMALGNRYSANGVTSVLIHKRPYELVSSQETSLGFADGDYVVCAADFDEGVLRFFINGVECASHVMLPSFREGPLIPIVGFASGRVKLNFSNLKLPVPELDKYLTIEEYSMQTKEQYLWDICDGVVWNELFRYGVKDNGSSKDPVNNRNREWVLKTFEYLTTQELSQCHLVCGLWHFILENGAVIRANQLRCYYSKQNFTQSMIGMMLQVEFKNGLSKKKEAVKNSNKRHVNKFRVSSDYISLVAWAKHNIHVDSTKEEFTHFLPLVINAINGKKAYPEIEKYLALLIPEGTFSPNSALEIICELLNANVESLSNQFVGGKIPHRDQLIHSLSVWSSLHHLLLFLHSKYPKPMTQYAEAQIRAFTASDGEPRGRENLPHLGKVLMYLLLTAIYDWHAVNKPFFEEHFCRDVPICTNIHKNLEDLQMPMEDRLKLTFGATERSRRRIMLQYIFLHEFGRPADIIITKTFDNYNLNYGGFSGKAPFQLLNACTQIVNCKDWLQFFRFLLIDTTESKVDELLKNAMSNAARKGYYNSTRKGSEITPRDSSLRTKNSNGTSGNRRSLYVEGPSRDLDANRPPRGRGENTRGFRDGRQSSRDGSYGKGRFDVERGGDSQERGGYEGRGGRGRGRGRGRGLSDAEDRYPRDSERRKIPRDGDKESNRGGQNSKDGKFWGQISEHAAMAYPAEAITDIKSLPTFLHPGLRTQGIEKWRKVQEEALPLLTSGKDTVVLSPAGSGKSTLLAIAALYRLYIKKDPVHVIILCPNDDHCVYMYQLIEKIGQQVPDLKVRLFDERKLENFSRGCFSHGRNIFIGRPRATRMLLEEGDADLTANTVAVYLSGCDALLGEDAIATKTAFEKIPQGIVCGLFSSSWCQPVSQVAKAILSTPTVVDHRADQKFCHWFVPLEVRDDKKGLLSLFCKLNPNKSGLIWCNSSEATELYESLRDSFRIQVLHDRTFSRESSQLIANFVAGKLEYIICSERAPTHELWKTQAHVIVNYNVDYSSQYAKRMACTGVTSAPVHVVSLVPKNKAFLFDSIEKDCEITIKELSHEIDTGFKPRQTSSQSGK